MFPTLPRLRCLVLYTWSKDLTAIHISDLGFRFPSALNHVIFWSCHVRRDNIYSDALVALHRLSVHTNLERLATGGIGLIVLNSGSPE